MAGMENQDLFICIDHVGLAVRDLDEAIKFHSEVFGWRELHREVNEEQSVAEGSRFVERLFGLCPAVRYSQTIRPTGPLRI